ncbi:MAG: hypothetical protein JWQ35_2629, partial [Bacteriovoracaceae bacterium]|nr:hypothetical protein [Bacteriovoracaceae bacterium]
MLSLYRKNLDLLLEKQPALFKKLKDEI